MNILIYDNDNLDRAKTLGKALRKERITAMISYNGTLLDAEGGTITETPTIFELVLWHKSNETAFVAAKVNAKCSISFSGGGGADIPRSLSAQSGFTEEESAHIVSNLNAGEGTGDLKGRILAYWGAYHLGRYALRLLCEAWWMNRDERDESKVSESKDYNGVIIRAPITPERWFSPFGKDVSQKSAQEIAAHLISRDVSAEAKAFLLDVAKRNSVPPEGVRKLAKVLGVAEKSI